MRILNQEKKTGPSCREVSQTELTRATGGTFTPNAHSKNAYHAVGISTSYHFIDKDEFQFMGRAISYSQANDIVDLARRVSDVLNIGQRGKNTVGYQENAFIRAFNSQLYLNYGYVWDGSQGHDF